MQFSIIKTGGKQYNVTVGQILSVEKVLGEVGSKVEFKDVMLAVDGDKFEVGQPFLADHVVVAEVLEQGRAKKVDVVKFKAKVHYRKKQGHRQMFTKVKILSIK